MRLIDADELLKRLPDDLPYKASVKRVLMQAETVEDKGRKSLQELFEAYAPRFEIKKLCIGCIHHKVCEEVNNLKCRDKFVWYDAQRGCPYYCHWVANKGFVESIDDTDKLDQLFLAGVITKEAYVRRLLQLAKNTEGDEE
jgi:hypothetical protein